MGTHCAFLLVFILALVLVNSGLADPEVGGDLKTGEKGKVLEVANAAGSGDGKKAVILGGDGSKEGGKSNGGLSSSVGVDVNGADVSQKNANDPGGKGKTKAEVDGKQLGSKGTGIQLTKTDDKGATNKSDLEEKSKDKGSKGAGKEGSGVTSPEVKKTKDKVSDEKTIKEKGDLNSGVNKEKAGVASLDSKDGTSVQERKEGYEACDSSSNSCTMEEKNVVACLRVPGNESPDLSLLVQNKGKGPVAVTISAPNFVKLERNQIQVKENDNEKVKVSIGNGESDGQIFLKAGNGKTCTLNFKGAVSHSSRKIPSYYMSLLRKPSYLWFIPLGAVLVVISALISISFRRKYVAKNNTKYQKLEMELPVSGVSKTVADSHNEQDDWDDNWDDNWDDEEVGMPATMPVTPSFSPGGIASRRVIKDAWKD